MRRLAILLLVVLPIFMGQASAEEASQRDAALERRSNALGSVLRCLVCQNQSIADSNAPLARDLKAQIRDQIAQGRSDTEILDYMVARYGDFVLYRPPMKGTTVVLWGGPFVALLAGLLVLMLKLRRMRRGEGTARSQAERMRAAEMLGIDIGQRQS